MRASICKGGSTKLEQENAFPSSSVYERVPNACVANACGAEIEVDALRAEFAAIASQRDITLKGA
jgi:hypothetical protein